MHWVNFSDTKQSNCTQTKLPYTKLSVNAASIRINFFLEFEHKRSRWGFVLGILVLLAHMLLPHHVFEVNLTTDEWWKSSKACSSSKGKYPLLSPPYLVSPDLLFFTHTCTHTEHFHTSIFTNIQQYVLKSTCQNMVSKSSWRGLPPCGEVTQWRKAKQGRGEAFTGNDNDGADGDWWKGKS